MFRNFAWISVHLFALLLGLFFLLSSWKFKCLTIFSWYLDKWLHGAHTVVTALNLGYMSDHQQSYVIPFEKMFRIFNEQESIFFFLFHLFAQLIHLSRYFCMCSNQDIWEFHGKIQRNIHNENSVSYPSFLFF